MPSDFLRRLDFSKTIVKKNTKIECLLVFHASFSLCRMLVGEVHCCSSVEIYKREDY